jgi:hypothetical protein
VTAVMFGSTTVDNSGSEAIASNVRGTAVIPSDATVTVASFTSGTKKFRGYMVMGTRDAEAWIEVDGLPLYGTSSRLTAAKEAYRILPNPELYASSVALVSLMVKNTGPSTGTFEGVIFNV